MGAPHQVDRRMLSALSRRSAAAAFRVSRVGLVQPQVVSAALFRRDFATTFTSDHEWVSDPVDGVITTGITDFAQNQLGDVVYVELPEVGDTFDQGDTMGVVESVKAASDVYAPVSGEIVEVNDSLSDDPAVVNTDPEGEAWWVKIKLSAPAELDELMDDDTYQELCEREG